MMIFVFIAIGVLIYFLVQKKKRENAEAESLPNVGPTSPDAAVRVSMKIVERKVTPDIAGLSTQMIADLTTIGQVPVHVLVARVTFSEAAKAAINQLKLKNDVLLSAPKILGKSMASYYNREGHSPSEIGFTVSQFLDGKAVQIPYDDIFAAQAGMTELQKKLEHLKSLFKVADAPMSKTVEI
jgi:hypothetical protein